MYDWAKEESKTADFGDERLNNRFAIILEQLGSKPHLSIPDVLRCKACVKFTGSSFVNQTGSLLRMGSSSVTRAAALGEELFMGKSAIRRRWLDRLKH
jgi:hypothetical protein